MILLIILLIILAVLTAIGGSAMLTQATQGVGAICFACFLAILARIAQAGQHHKEAMRAAGVLEPVKKAVDPLGLMRCTACNHEFPPGPKACPSCGAVFT